VLSGFTTVLLVYIPLGGCYAIYSSVDVLGGVGSISLLSGLGGKSFLFVFYLGSPPLPLWFSWFMVGEFFLYTTSYVFVGLYAYCTGYL